MNLYSNNPKTMKKNITFLVLFTCLGVFAQKNVAQKVNELLVKQLPFVPYSILESTAGLVPDNAINKVVGEATLAKIKGQSLALLMANKPETIEVGIPYQNKMIEVQLYKVNLFAEGFHVDTDKSQNVAYQEGVYYRGIVKGDLESLVSFSFFNNELNGMISSETWGNLVIGRLDRTNNTSDYIIYSDAKLKIANDFKCHTKESSLAELPEVAPEAGKTLSTKCVTIYFEVDYSLYQANGSNTTTTNNWVSSVFNNVQTLYTNDGISVALKSIHVWTSQDPYSGTSSSDYLYQFHNNTCVFDGDLGQLLGIDSGGLGGVAVGINGLCTQNNFSYSDVNFSYSSVPIFSWTIEVITHELGHLLGSPHTHGCYWNGNNTAIDGCGSSVGYVEGSCAEGPIPTNSVKGTIMSYCHLVNNVGINLANGFGPQPAARILSSINNAGCLGTNCTNTCVNSVCTLSASNITGTSAVIDWTETNPNTSSWQLYIAPFNNASGAWTAVNATTYIATNLLPNTFYRAKVSPNCGATFTAPAKETIFLTAANYCNGIVLTDTGGTTADYQDDQNYIRTIIPNVANKKISLTFSSFNLESDFDYLYIYDGNSTAATDLSAGGFTGTTIPGPFTSTAADGSLTLKFYSDGGVVAPGYVANVGCINALGTSQFVPNIDFTYYPNPTSGLVSINSKTEMQTVFVYNLEGRLLYENKINALNTKVDMTAFARGTYFFKLKFNEKEVNFKILKMN